MKNPHPFLPLHIPIGAVFAEQFEIEFGTWYRAYTQRGNKLKQFDSYLRKFMWTDDHKVLLVNVTEESPCRFCNAFDVVGETYRNNTGKTCVILQQNLRSSGTQNYVRKLP